MDNRTPEKRSWNMSRIPSKNTKPELIVRSWLHRNGFRFRLCVSSLPGKPDIVLPKYHVAIQVRGCFWHRHNGCKITTTPKSNTAFWLDKFSKNVERDFRNDASLRALGWDVIVIWQCEIANEEILRHKLLDVLNSKRSSSIT